jgi:hypothetical protein
MTTLNLSKKPDGDPDPGKTKDFLLFKKKPGTISTIRTKVTKTTLEHAVRGLLKNKKFFVLTRMRITMRVLKSFSDQMTLRT